MRLMRMASVLSAAAFMVAAFVPSTVVANINVEPRLEDPLTGIVTLFFLNFGTDLLLVGLAVYVALWLARRRIGAIPSEPGNFVVSVLAAATAVAVTGAVIDFVFLYDRVEDHYLLKDFSAGILVLPAVLIFATIAASLQAVVRTDWRTSLVAAAAIAPLSPLAWWFLSSMAGSVIVLFVLVAMALSGLFSVLLLVFLHGLHVRVFSGEMDRVYEGCAP
jgi:hypothetical protein